MNRISTHKFDVSKRRVLIECLAQVENSVEKIARFPQKTSVDWL